MNLKEIKEIIKLMNENELVEIEVERDGSKIKVKKANTESNEVIYKRPIEYKVAPPSRQEVKESSSEPVVDSNKKEIKSPMVGTFYSAPSPEASPFAEVGKVVEIGQVVCIVEAMKLMNEIKSEVKGKIVEILVSNAQPVEFGQTLFTVDPV